MRLRIMFDGFVSGHAFRRAARRRIVANSGAAEDAINAINAIINHMASITIRKLPEETKRRLRIRAACNGHSMEQEARELLEAELDRAEAASENLGEVKRRRRMTLDSEAKRSPRRGPGRDPGIR